MPSSHQERWLIQRCDYVVTLIVESRTMRRQQCSSWGLLTWRHWVLVNWKLCCGRPAYFTTMPISSWLNRGRLRGSTSGVPTSRYSVPVGHQSMHCIQPCAPQTSSVPALLRVGTEVSPFLKRDRVPEITDWDGSPKHFRPVVGHSSPHSRPSPPNKAPSLHTRNGRNIPLLGKPMDNLLRDYSLWHFLPAIPTFS
jgi:hypothetical protein